MCVSTGFENYTLGFSRRFTQRSKYLWYQNVAFAPVEINCTTEIKPEALYDSFIHSFNGMMKVTFESFNYLRCANLSTTA